MMKSMVAAIKALRDAAIAKRAAQPPDDITIGPSADIIQLKPKPAKRIKPIAHDDAPSEPPISLPLVVTASWHTAYNINDDPAFDMPKFKDEATENYRAQQKMPWRDGGVSQLPRKHNDR